MSSHEEVARAALADFGHAGTVGELLGSTDEDGVQTLNFAATVSGYPGWHWSVSIAQLPGEAPTVLEAELLPGDGALLAPDWVPWAERLEEYRAAQAAAAAERGEDSDEPDDDDSDDDDSDDDDSDDDAEDEFDDSDDEFDDELDVSARGDDEQDETEPESGDDGPEGPVEA